MLPKTCGSPRFTRPGRITWNALEPPWRRLLYATLLTPKRNPLGYKLFRVLSNGTDPLEEYKPAYEIFVSATNFLAVSPTYAGALRT